MKTKSQWRYGVVVSLLTLFVLPQLIHGGESSRLRVIRDRAEIVVKRKNLFIERVLNSYDIAFKRDQHDVVVKIFLSEKWYELKRIEIVPQMDKNGRPISGGGHEIYFLTTDGEVLFLLSDIRIK